MLCSAANAADPIRVGAVLPFSGGVELYGQQAKLGLDLAAKEINAAGRHPRLTIPSPTGPVTIDANHYAAMTMFIAKTQGSELVTVRALGEIAPQPGCTMAAR